MSSFLELGGTLGKSYAATCKNFTDDYISEAMIIFNYFPIYLTMIVFALSFNSRSEALIWILLSGGLFNWLISAGIRWLISAPGPQGECFVEQQMPAYATDILTFTIITALVCSTFIYKVYLSSRTTIFLATFAPFALYSNIWLRINTGPQLLAGLGLGLGEALLYCLLVAWIVDTKFIEKWLINRNYIFALIQNTMIPGETVTLQLEDIPDKLKLKCASSSKEEGFVPSIEIETS